MVSGFRVGDLSKHRARQAVTALGEDGLGRACSMAVTRAGKQSVLSVLSGLADEAGAKSCFALRVIEAVVAAGGTPRADQVAKKVSLESLMLSALKVGLLPKWNTQTCPEVGRVVFLLRALQEL